MNINQDNTPDVDSGVQNSATLSAISASAMVGKKSTTKKARKGSKTRSQSKGKTAALAAETPITAVPARRGRPPLSEQEKQKRREKLQNHRTVLTIINASLAREAARAKRGASKPTSPKGAGRNRAGKKSRTQPSSEPAEAQAGGDGLGVAQRHLGIDFDEANEGVENQAPRVAQRLPENVKKFIIIRNACGNTPREVIREVYETFGLKLTSSQISRYDPTTAAGQTLRDDYKRLFAEMRREHQGLIDLIGFGSSGSRIAMLHNQLTKAVEEGDAKLALYLLDQAAREKGAGCYSKGPGSGSSSRRSAEKLKKAGQLASFLDGQADNSWFASPSPVTGLPPVTRGTGLLGPEDEAGEPYADPEPETPTYSGITAIEIAVEAKEAAEAAARSLAPKNRP